MRHQKCLLLTGLLSLALAASVEAKVPAEQAARLRNGDLTPLGAEKAGSKSGTIPAWNGGWTKAPADWKGPGTRSTDPFPEDKPLLTITSQNLAQYRDKLSAGQIALFQQYPKTYKMNVYVTRRTAGAPKFVYEATYQNALNADLGSNGEAVVNGVIGIPFPIAQNGHEAIWNHKLRYRAQGIRHTHVQAAVTDSGAYTPSKLKEDITLKYGTRGITPDELNNVSVYFLQTVTAPPRLAGTILLVHETMDQVKEPRRAWAYNPGQRRLRRAPNVGYDNPGTASDGLRTNDQYDSFNGAMDRYTWKIVGKKEMYVPYNDYRLHSDKLKYRDILQPGHINKDLVRYELHRVWVVEANLRAGTTHIYKRRTFHLDEDSWSILVVDCYDKRDRLWRVQEAHTLANYDPGPLTREASGRNTGVMEAIYDLTSRRYLAMTMNNEEEERQEQIFPESYYDPSNVSKLATK